jgi:hypothetical protein
MVQTAAFAATLASSQFLKLSQGLCHWACECIFKAVGVKALPVAWPSRLDVLKSQGLFASGIKRMNLPRRSKKRN